MSSRKTTSHDDEREQDVATPLMHSAAAEWERLTKLQIEAAEMLAEETSAAWQTCLSARDPMEYAAAMQVWPRLAQAAWRRQYEVASECWRAVLGGQREFGEAAVAQMRGAGLTAVEALRAAGASAATWSEEAAAEMGQAGERAARAARSHAGNGRSARGAA